MTIPTPDKKPVARIIVRAIILNAENQVLIVRRHHNLRFGGLWSLPGGKIEVGEDLWEAAKREAFEETGLAVSDPKPVFPKSFLEGSDFRISMGFLCRREGSSQVVLNEEHTEYAWVSKDDALGYDLAPECRFFVEQIP